MTAKKKAILFISTSSNEAEAAIAARELHDLHEVQDRSHGRDQVQIVPILNATLEDIPREFRRVKFVHDLTVVHITGSGSLDGSWKMPTQGGGHEFIDPHGLARLIAELDTTSALQLVVFNGCYSDTIARLFAPAKTNVAGWARQTAIKSRGDYDDTVRAALGFTSQLYAALFDHESRLSVPYPQICYSRVTYKAFWGGRRTATTAKRS